MDSGPLAREEGVLIPTTEVLTDPSSNVALEVVQGSHEEHSSMYRVQVALFDKMTQEVWKCDMGMREEPDTLYVNNGQYKIATTIIPSKNTQVYIDEVPYLQNPALPFGAFTIILPRSRPAERYHVKFSLFKRHSGHSDHQYTECSQLDVFYWPYTSSIQHPLSKIKFSAILLRKSSWKIITYFEDLTDNGYSDQFERDREHLQDYVDASTGHEELLALVLLTECGAQLVRHRMEDAVRLAKEACRISSKQNGPNNLFIQGYAKVLLAALYRLRGDFEAVDDQLASALGIFQQLEPSEYSCNLYYSMGASVMEKSALGIEISADESRRAERAFRWALEHWERQKQMKTRRRPQRIHNRQISLFLKSTPGKAPYLDNVVSEENLSRANAALVMFERELLDDCLPWPRTLFYLNKTDYFIRMGNVEEGFLGNCQAMKIAKAHGFQREITGAEERARCLEAMRRQQQVSVPESWSGGQSPQQQPSGPPEDYDFMQELLPLAERRYLQLPLMEDRHSGAQNPGNQLAEQHPPSANEDDEVMEVTGHNE